MRLLPACLAVLCLAAQATAQPRAVEDAAVTWRESFDGFGSYSGLVLSADGTRFITVSDKGSFANGRLERMDGHLTGVTLDAHGPLRDPDGKPVERFDVDAEGLTVGADGRLYVSFEANHRVWGYDDLAGPATPTPRHVEKDRLQNNSSLEALFTGPDGALYTIPERSGRLARPFPIHRFKDGAWDIPFSLPRSGAFLVTGADIGPDGRLYVLERDFRQFSGFAIRIRRFEFGSEGVSGEAVLLETGPGTYDNLEGIVAWRDGEGALRLTTISDDNNSFFQRTQIVEFIVAE